MVRSALEHGCRISSDEIVVTNGCIEALNLSLRAVTRHGDRVAVESPCYFVLLQMLRSLGLVAVPIPCDPLRGMDLAVLADVLQTTPIAAVVSVANGNNPVGSVANDEDKAALVAMLAARNIPLIEDDMFGDVCFASSRPSALRSFDRRGGVLWCGGLSKTLMPSLRLGWVAAGRFTAQVQALKYTTTMATSELFQVAAAELMENGGYARHLKRLRQTLGRQHAALRQAVLRYFPPGTEVSQAAGGYVAWVRLPHGKNDPASTRHLFARAREAGIGFAPGYLFGGREFDDCLRLNAGYPWNREQEEAIAHLGKLVKEQQETGHFGQG
ncbi:MAG TPA: PLP-dependent aminotransferase family protein [Sinorhizobium sp.]|nr:PLP-dependent aminotransferase family protein [Sinorhizobium sp.]